jgi:hypothetical protein
LPQTIATVDDVFEVVLRQLIGCHTYVVSLTSWMAWVVGGFVLMTVPVHCCHTTWTAFLLSCDYLMADLMPQVTGDEASCDKIGFRPIV